MELDTETPSIGARVRRTARLKATWNAHVITLFVAAVAVATVIVTFAVAVLETKLDHSAVNWWAFAIFAVLLIIAEARPSFSLHFAEGGEITPGWAFAFSLLLLGAPFLAVLCTALATLIADLVAHKPTIKMVFNVCQVSLSLGLGGLVLHSSGLNGPALRGDISFVQSLGMIGAGFTVLVTSAMLLFVVMSLSRGISLRVPIREGWMTSITADGALLAVAPIFVIAVDYSLLLLPLLAVTSFIVFTSARQAMHQAHAASHDPLTQMRNRNSFHDILQHRLLDMVASDAREVASTEASRVILLLIDLDGFKEVNDRLGHATGDGLLVAFAARMERTIPSDAIAARLGGDEFAILIEGSNSIEVEMKNVHDLRSRLSQTLSVGGVPLSIVMSIGMACSPDHAMTAEELLSCADVAMYRAKRFRTGVELYGSVGAAREHGRIGLLGALSEAIENNQLSLAYQPLVRIATGQCDGVEALLRWQHSTLGAIPPGDFITVAEHTDLIVPITQFVLERAVRDTVSMNAPGVSVSINISARNLQDRHFPDLVFETLGSSGLAPHRLELEITESAIASEPERSRYAIDALREVGVRVAIDDFGTGYSSFISLRDLEVDRLKIDRGFIERITSSLKDEILVRSIIGLASELGLQTVAEGIEDMETWDLVRSLGCDVAQGFVIARPLSFEQLTNWLSRRQALTELSDFELRTLVG
jgi:diguanylate cyclase (GGDEF)-like protein